MDATEVDLSGSDLDNVSSVDRPYVRTYICHMLSLNYATYSWLHSVEVHLQRMVTDN